MGEPFLSEIRIFGFNFPPRNWTKCDGQILPIDQNQALYSLLGTSYGGDGRTDFGLPDLRGRTPIGFGSSSGVTTRSLGEKDGEESNVFTKEQLPSHTHTVNASSADNTSRDPSGRYPANTPSIFRPYQALGSTTTTFNTNAIANNSGGQGLNNMQPFLTLNFCIAIAGTFPSRN